MIKNLPNLKQVLAALLTIAALATGQTAWAWDGSGTSDSPWLIKTTDDLVTLANNSASTTYSEKFFRLENDLDMSGVAIGTIGGNSKRFKGTFDGNGHAIRNLTINKPDDNYVALFGTISANSTIRNLIIDGANITGNNNVGVIFGCTFNGGTIENCLVVNSSVTVTSSTGTYGGIISGCYLDNLTFSGNYYYNCSVTMGSNAPVTTNIATTGGDIDGAAIADATATVSLPDAWVTFGANQFVVGGYYYNGTIYYDSSIGYTVGPATWAALQTAFNNASTDADNPTELTLAADITASASDSYLNLTGGRKVILDLNGQTLSRGLTAATTDGYVIRVIGTNTSLTIRDGATGGTITGGWSNSGPGCISVTSNATLRLESGTISGNRVNRSGGTISITGGTVYITGGTITGNWANIETWNNNSFASCGAIYFNEGGTLYMSGGAITGNRCRTTTLGAAGIGASLMLSHRVHLSGSYNISGNEQGDYDEATGEWSNLTPSDILNNNCTLYILDGPINPVAPAHMILDHDGSSATFTSGWATHMGSTDPEQCFTIDPATGKGLGIVNGEVHVGPLHSLTLADGLTASVTQAAQGKSVTLSGAAPSVSRYLVSYNDGEARTDHYAADTLGNATFLMPDADVMVSTETAVTYIDADGNEQTITDFTIVSSSYEFGDDFSTGTALLGVDDYTERWYAVVGTVSLDKRLSVEGNARLILCDAAALIVNADYDCGTAFDFSYNGLTIYGQAQGTGTLSVTNTGGAIYLLEGDITINGGTVIATSTDIFEGISICNGRTLTINRGTLTASGGNGINININGTLTQNGGTLNATGSGTNYAGIYAAYDATVNILGGTLNATGTADAYGIYATGDGTTVTLGWTTPDDRITASSYSGTVKIADGKALKNGGTVYYGTLTAAQKSAIANVTLQPATQAEFIAAALPQTGTYEYTIYDSVGWNAFCLALDDNDTWNRFSGKTVNLGADITVTRMAGSSYHDFMGTFDGQGHTLTVDYGSAESPITADNAAPFVNVESGCIIKNLHVAGDIYTKGMNAAGIAGTQYGAVTIRNCRVSTAIHSYTIGDGTHGGLVGNNGNGNGSALNIEGCVFDGKLLTEGETATNKCGGFVGWCHKEVTISNSLFAPTEVTIGTTSSATFARNGATITNCYYTTDFNDGVNFIDQGKQARSITAGDYVTVENENAGTATTYSTSGITSYGTGIKYNNVLYAGSGETVSLTLDNTVPEGFTFTDYSVTEGAILSGSENPYTLTMPDADVVITANTNVNYIDVNGETQQCTDYIWLTGTETTLGAAGQETWCVVHSTLNYSHGIQLLGNTHIILCDGKTMTITSSYGYGIDVDSSLTIYGQELGTGTLNATGNNRGIVNGGDITIIGGTLNATGNDNGINSYSGNITISGGTVTATGNRSIFTHSGNITISGGRVTATSENGYGIYSYAGTTTLGWTNATDFIYVSRYHIGTPGTLNIAEGKTFIDEAGYTYSSGTGTVNASAIAGKTLYPYIEGSVPYIDENGQRQLCTDYNVLNGTETSLGTSGQETWYVADGTLNYGQTITLSGDVHLILKDNAVMNVGTQSTITYGIGDGSSTASISIYGQSTGNSQGQLHVNVSAFGICAKDGNLTINGGEVVVTSSYSLGIFANGGNITINGGEVVATSSADGGLGIYASGGNVIINGGEVEATGNNTNGEGIFATKNSSGNGGSISISNATVTANGSIGIQANSGITINSGTVTTNNCNYGIYASSCSLTINGGQVTANGSTYGIYAEGGNVNISGGEVEATGNNTNGNGGGILAIKRSGNGGSISISNATVTATGYIGIRAQSGITINSGTVTANNCNYGIYADVSNLTISGGQVTANGNSCGIFGDNITITSGEVTANGPYGIYADNGNLIISGGQVTANGNSCGIFGDNITLGWTNASDFIYANSYYATGTLSIAEGKAFKDVDGNNYESGPVNASDINGKWLYPNTVSLFTKTIAAHQTEEGVNYGWCLIASPLSGETNAEAVAHLINTTNPENFDLYRFDQAADLEWENWKQQNSDHYHFNLEPGRGYLYANAAVVNLVFAGTPYSGNGKVTLQKTEGAELSGWNLVGNPFAVGATLSQPFYRMNPEGTALSAQVEAGNTVEAMEGVFVQATGDDQTVTFTAQTRGGEKAAIAQANIMVVGDNGAVIDNAIIRFDGGQTLEKFSFREGSTKIYIPQDGTDYAIACAESTGEMPVNFKAETDGTYTISVNVDNVEMGYLHLIDNMTGSDIDLLAMNNGDARPCVSTYTFTAKTTDYESRFKLVFAVGSSTGSDTFAFFSNGNWIVSNEGHATLQVIDVNGRILISEQINGSISKAINQPAGVYMLRLVKGENVRTQKIVVE